MLPTLGMELDLARLDRGGGRLLQLVDGHEPLLGFPRLELRVAPVARHDGVSVVLDALEQAQLLECLDDGLARLVAVHAGELAVAFHHMGRLVEDVDARQVVALPHAPVVGVVCGRDFHEAGAKLGVDDEVLEDGDDAIDEGQADLRAHELLLVGVFGRDRHARVAEHGLGARGGHDDVLVPVDRLDERVAQMPEVT